MEVRALPCSTPHLVLVRETDQQGARQETHHLRGASKGSSKSCKASKGPEHQVRGRAHTDQEERVVRDSMQVSLALVLLLYII